MKNVQHSSALSGATASVAVSSTQGQSHAPVVAAISDSDPADVWLAITPNDDTVYDPAPTAVFVGTGGNISLVDSNGVAAVFKNIPNASILPLQPTRVRATGTTAADIVLIFRSDLA